MVLLLSHRSKFMRHIFIKIFLLIISLTIASLVGYYLTRNQCLFRSSQCVLSQSTTEQNKNNIGENAFNISRNVHIFYLTTPIKTKFQCIKTKKILHNLSTNICLHEQEKDVFVSDTFRNANAIFEEQQVIRILQLLIRHPHLHFIDIGANIGAYTMFVAALGRFVLAIDCFAPNLVRLHRAIQLSNVSDRVVLVQNALFTHSGQSLRLSVVTNNIGGQGIYLLNDNYDEHLAENHISTEDPYIVKTITFDEILPILLARGIRGALMKIDIEGSESFIVQNGSHVFDTLYIPFIQMEWKIVRQYADRVNIIFDFFAKRSYDSMTELCALLNVTEFQQWPDDIYWLKRNVSNFC
jgi:FkbM family methyltransferase